MQFIYHPEAKTPSIKIEGELYNYIFKVRRHSSSDDIYLRNLNDKNIYKYQIVNIDRRKAMLKLQSYEEKIKQEGAVQPKKEKVSFFEGIKTIFTNPYLLGILFIVMAYEIIVTIFSRIRKLKS